MTPSETPSELRAAFDVLLAGAHRQLRLYDRDLDLLQLDHVPRHTALRALCVAGAGRRVELLLDDISRVAPDHPRLMQLVRDFGHVLEIRQAHPDASRPDHAFVLADRRGVLRRPDKGAMRGTLDLDAPRDAEALHRDFDAIWQRSQTGVTATTLGL